MNSPAHSGHRVERLNALTGLRFVAAAAIVVLHSSGWFGFPEGSMKSWGLGQAVSFFFVLSGFVLTYAYPKLSDSRSIGNFYVVRIARLWPVHVISLLLLLILFPARSWTLPADHIALVTLTNVTLMQTWLPFREYFFSFNGPSWSISVELFLYLLFPYLVSRIERNWVTKLTVSLLLVIALISAAEAMHLPPNDLTYRGISNGALVGINPVSRLFEFVLGMTVELLRRKLSQLALSRGIATLVELSALGLTSASVIFSYRRAAELSWIVGSAGAWWLTVSGSCIAFGLLILVMALQKGYVSAFLARPIPVLLGEISYSVYLLHYILIRYYNLHEYAFRPIPEWLAYGLFWIILLLLSHLSWCLIERPCRSLLVGLWTGGPAIGTRLGSLLSAGRSRIAGLRKMPTLEFPKRPAMLVEITVLLGLALATGYMVHHPPSSLHVITSPMADDLLTNSRSETRKVRFGSRFLLQGLTLTRTQDGLLVEMIWESMTDQQLTFLNGIHLVDEHGTILEQADYPQDYAKSHVAPGTLWKDTVKIASKKLRGAQAVALAVYDLESGTLLIDQGPRDWDNHRMILPFD